MTHHIIGYGQIGKSIGKVLGKHTYQNDEVLMIGADIAHVCFPYHKNFVRQVRSIVDEFSIVIVHSTVPVGTMKKIGTPNLVYSPVRGKHPNLTEGIKTFVKYFAGKGTPLSEVMKVFIIKGVKCYAVNKYETLELAKLIDTTYYGWNIVFMKAVEEICKKSGADFNTVYTEWTKTYNDGYIQLGLQNVVRPVLKPRKGKIGGHCIVPNARLLKDFSPAQYILAHDN